MFSEEKTLDFECMLTIKYLDKEGNNIANPLIIKAPYGTKHTVEKREFTGYTYYKKGDYYPWTMTLMTSVKAGGDHTSLIYKKIEGATETTESTESPNEKAPSIVQSNTNKPKAALGVIILSVVGYAMYKKRK